MNKVKGFVVGCMAAALLLAGPGSVAAQEDEGPSPECVAIAQQAAQYDAAFADARAQLAALDAEFGPEFDAVIAAYSVYLDSAEATLAAQVAAAEALFGC